MRYAPRRAGAFEFCEEPGVRYAPQRGPLFLWDMCRKAYRYAARTIWAVPAIRDRF